MQRPRLTSTEVGQITYYAMEVLTSAWFLLLISCTDWFGIRQCVGLPVPTLNYYQGPSQNNWNFKYRQSRNPISYYEKFTFPNKEPQLIFGDRSGKVKQDSGKIFFPDEVSEADQGKQHKSYHFSDSEVRPIWKIHHRPSTATLGSSPREQSLGKPMQLPPDENLNGNAIEIPYSQRSEIPEPTSRERIAVAVEQFYDWVRNKESSKRKLSSKTAQSENGVVISPKNCQLPTNQDEVTTPKISDQSLVSGLKGDQECPDGQVRLEDGECKVIVAV